MTVTPDAARRAIAQAIDSGEAHHTQFDVERILIDVYTATGGFDITAMDRLTFQAVVDRHQLPLVNVVAVTGPTTAPGLTYDEAVRIAPAVECEYVRAFLTTHLTGDDVYVLVVPESVWSDSLIGLPGVTIGVRADQAAALYAAITSQAVEDSEVVEDGEVAG